MCIGNLLNDRLKISYSNLKNNCLIDVKIKI